MSDHRDGPDGYDDDLWSEPTASPPPRRGKDRTRRPPARGPARPPRRGEGREPRAPEASPPRARRDRPGRPGAIPAAPSAATGVAGAAPAGHQPDPGAHGAVAVDAHDDDLVELPREGSFPRWLIVVIVLLVVLGSVIGGVLWWYDRQLNPPGGPGDVVMVEIPQGSSIAGIGSTLDREGVISNSMVFNFYASRQEAGPFEAGVYELRENSSFDLALDTLAEGPTAPLSRAQDVRVSIPEGLTVDQLLDRVADQVPRFEREELQAAVDDGAVETDLRPGDIGSYEGLLFPATYEVGSSTTEVEFLDQLAAEMSRRVAAADVDAARARILDTYGVEVDAYELLIIASMVQAEAGNEDEAPQIATVIYNRLSENMPLGIDAVDRYGAQLAGVSVDYEDTDAPYNTRRNAGMPPTPIAAPGDFALDAAFNPADGPWRYYVLTEERAHTFSVTLDEHNAATAICRDRDLGCG